MALPGLISFKDRALLPANDYADWLDLGNDVYLPSGSTLGSKNLNLLLTMANALGEDLWVGKQSDTWWGNFAPGDGMLWSGTGPLSITFPVGICAGGAQIQWGSYWGAFAGILRAYDASGNLLGSYSQEGLSSGDEDNSAIFLGLFDPAGRIRRLAFDIEDCDFGINQLNFLAAGPGPASLLAPFRPMVEGGGAITALAGPQQALYWSLISYDPLTGLAGPPLGSLKYDHTRADKAGLAVNLYLAPTDPAAAGKVDRVFLRWADA